MSLAIEDIAPALQQAFGYRLTVKEIQRVVAEFYGLHPSTMVRPDGVGSREPRVSHPRQVAMFFARKLTPLSTTVIGRHFGGRDHTTVLHAKKVVEMRADRDPFVEMELEVLRERLGA